MKIGILLCGHAPEELQDSHGDYDAQFARLLGDEHFEYETWEVLEQQIPQNVHAADGWLITGSKHGVYEAHPWIAPLEDFLRHAYQQSVPIVGICFGHQILAQALGGNVEKFAGGWSVGHVDYQVEGLSDATGVMAFHQDQIIELPPEADAYGSTPFCQYAFVAYGDQAMSMQPHPEFTKAYLLDLIDARGKVLPADIVTKGKIGAERPLATEAIATQITDFFQKARNPQQGRKA